MHTFLWPSQKSWTLTLRRRSFDFIIYSIYNKIFQARSCKSLGFSEKILSKNSLSWLAYWVKGMIRYFPGFNLNRLVTWGKHSNFPESATCLAWTDFPSKRFLDFNLKILNPTTISSQLCRDFVIMETIKVPNPSLSLSFKSILNWGLVTRLFHGLCPPIDKDCFNTLWP